MFLLKIAEIVKKAIRGCRDQVDFDSMVFVINKWDTVSQICYRLDRSKMCTITVYRMDTLSILIFSHIYMNYN